MRLMGKLVSLAIRQQLTYRAAILSGLATNFYFAVLRVSLLTALYGTQTDVNGMSLTESITFVLISQAVIAFLSVFGSYDQMRSVYSGEVGGDLIRPVDFFRFWMARDFGRSLVNLVLRGIVLVAIGGFFYRLALPESAGMWLAVVVSLLLSWLISFAWRFLVNLSAFWTPDALGICRLGFAFSQFFSGFILPLRLMPDWFSQMCAFTPFPSMVNTVVEIYLGNISGMQVVWALLIQLGWFAALWLLMRVVLNAGVRRLVIQGG